MSIRRLLFLFSLTCLTMVGCGDEKDEQKSCDGSDCNVPADPCAKCTENQTCEEGECKDKVEDPCSKCTENQTCEDGECKDKAEGPCSKCTENQICENGECKDKVEDPCAKCTENQTCEEGECKDKVEDPCSKCTDNQTCEEGECKDKVEDPCSKCTETQTCEDGECKDKVEDPCSKCTDNQTCENGECKDKVVTCNPACGDDEVCKDGKCVTKAGYKKCSGNTLIVWDGYQNLAVDEACGVEGTGDDAFYAAYVCVAGELKTTVCEGYQACGNEGGRLCSADLRVKEGSKCPNQKNFKKCSWDGLKVLQCNGETYEEYKACGEGMICMYDFDAINNKFNCVIR